MELDLQLFGVGCSQTERLFEETLAILGNYPLEAQISLVRDIDRLVDPRWDSIPCLVINGEQVSVNCHLDDQRIIEIIEEHIKNGDNNQEPN